MVESMSRNSDGEGRLERTHVQVLSGLGEVAREAAELFVELCQAISGTGHVFSVALSGGSTPRALHQLLSSPAYRDQVDWSQVRFFFGDERYVPSDDPMSNYRMANETLLEKLGIGQSQIHRIPTTEVGDPALAAARYEEDLRAAFLVSSGQLPQFDLIFLGLGPDGHTASLFPHTSALRVTDRLVAANFVPKLADYRITLTVPVINNAAAVAFLVAGSDKASAVDSVLLGPSDPDEFPAQLVAPIDGDLYWFIDQEAGAKLSKRQPAAE
jgi:6-phosphogluconolactonase